MKNGLKKEDQKCEDCHNWISPGNELIWGLIREAYFGLFDGLGGVHFNAIEYIFEKNNIPHYQRDELFEKFLVYIEVMKSQKDE